MENKEINTLETLAEESGISLEKIKNANITSDEWIKLTLVAAKLADYLPNQ